MKNFKRQQILKQLQKECAALASLVNKLEEDLKNK